MDAGIHPRDGKRGWLSRTLRFTTWTTIIMLVLAVSSVGASAWYIADTALQPETVTYRWTVEDFSSLDPEPVQFQSSAGITLAGRFFAGTSGATIILSHGYAATQDQVLPWVYILNEEGFNIFTYDMRSRGQSGGKHVTFGALEQYDLISAVDYISSRADVDPERIGVAGLSLGGAVSILAAAKDERIKAVVSVSAFSDLENVAASNLERLLHVPAFPFATAMITMSELQSGVDISEAKPVDVIGSISPRPILLVHGANDDIVSWPNGYRNYQAAGNPKQIIWVPDGGHNLSHDLFWGEPRKIIVEFLAEELRVNRSPPDFATRLPS